MTSNPIPIWRILTAALIALGVVFFLKIGLLAIATGSHHYVVGGDGTPVIRDAHFTGLPARLLGAAYVLIAISMPIVAWVISQFPDAGNYKEAISAISRKSLWVSWVGLAAVFSLFGGIAVVVSAVIWPEG